MDLRGNSPHVRNSHPKQSFSPKVTCFLHRTPPPHCNDGLFFLMKKRNVRNVHSYAHFPILRITSPLNSNESISYKRFVSDQSNSFLHRCCFIKFNSAPKYRNKCEFCSCKSLCSWKKKHILFLLVKYKQYATLKNVLFLQRNCIGIYLFIRK